MIVKKLPSKIKVGRRTYKSHSSRVADCTNCNLMDFCIRKFKAKYNALICRKFLMLEENHNYR